MSASAKCRYSTDCTFTTPTSRGPDSMGTESMEWKRSSSRPGTHFQCGSRLTSGTDAGRRVWATQPVMPSPTLMTTLPTIFTFSPLVAVRSSSRPGVVTR